MADKRLNIKVRTDGAKRAKKDLKGVEGGMRSLGKAAAKAGAAFFAAGAIINGLQKVIELAGKQELAEKKLSIALGRTSDALLKQASALQQVTMFGDEAIIEQQAFLASLKFTEEQIKTIIPVAIDLAAATGISLESAVRNTAKTFSGLAGELGELIPQLRDLTAEEMKAGEAVKIMAELFGGQGKEQTETMTGAIEQMKNAVGDAGEAVGELLGPVVITVAKSIKLLAEGIGAVTGSFNKFIEGAERAQLDAKILKGFTDNKVAVDEFAKSIGGLSDEALFDLAVTFDDTTQSLFNLTQAEKDQAKKAEIIFGEYVKRQEQKAESEEKNKQLQTELDQAFLKQGETLGQLQLSEINLAEIRKKAMQETVEETKKALVSIEDFDSWAKSASASLATSAIMGDSVTESLKRAVIQLGIMVAQAKIYAAIMATATPGGFFATIGSFLFGASPTRAFPSPNGPGAKITINQNFGGMGVIDHNFAANSIIPAINKAINTGQARIG